MQDAGHGGKDPGAVAKGNVEKVYTLEAAKYVDKRLGELGVSSVMTRTSDVTLEPDARTKKVKSCGAKVCLSHHFNAGGGLGAEFIHSIYVDGKFEKILKEEFEKEGYPVRRIFSRKGSHGKDYYYMHRETGKVKTTIIEYDFLDGPNANKIKDKRYRQGMYECVVRAVCRYEGVKYKENTKGSTKKKQDSKKVLHRVQVGAFSDPKNAEKLAEELKKKGYPVYVVSE